MLPALLIIASLAIIGGAVWSNNQRRAEDAERQMALELAAMEAVATSEPWSLALRNAIERMTATSRMHGDLAPFIVVDNISRALGPPIFKLRKISEGFWQIKDRTTEAARDEIVRAIVVDAEPWIKEIRGAALEFQGRVLVGKRCKVEDVDSVGCWEIICENQERTMKFRLIGKSMDAKLDAGSASKSDRIDVNLLIAIARPSIQLGPRTAKKGSDSVYAPVVAGFHAEYGDPHEFFGIFVPLNGQLPDSLEGVDEPCAIVE